MTRFRSLFAVAVALMLITAATPAVAQVCMGLPLTAGQTALGLGASFPDGATGYGVGARHKLTDQIVLGAGYTLTSIDEDEGDDIPSQHTFSAGGAYEFLVQG